MICNEKSFVIKCFQKDVHKRELENYRILRFFWRTLNAARYRLDFREDMCAPEIARRIAGWYRHHLTKLTLPLLRRLSICGCHCENAGLLTVTRRLKKRYLGVCNLRILCYNQTQMF